MKRSPATPADEETVTAGHQTLGRIIPRAGGFEVYDAEGKYRFKAASLPEARVALFNLSREVTS